MTPLDYIGIGIGVGFVLGIVSLGVLVKVIENELMGRWFGW